MKFRSIASNFKSLPFGSTSTKLTESISVDCSVSSGEDNCTSIWKLQDMHKSSKHKAYLQQGLITLPAAGLKKVE